MTNHITQKKAQKHTLTGDFEVVTLVVVANGSF